MNCYKYKQLIDKMHADCIDNNELQSIKHHIAECESCSTYYSIMEQMINDLSSFEEKELPEGFRNKLHFALKREAESPSKAAPNFVKSMKFAAVGAFSVLLVLAAVSILPKIGLKDAIPNMRTADEAMEEAPIMEMQGMEKAADEETFAMLAETPEEAESVDLARAEESVAETEEEETANDAGYIVPCPCEPLIPGESIILVLDVDDIQAAYNNLLEYLPDPLPDSSWVIADMDEPSDYMQLRVLMDVNQADIIAEQITIDYTGYVDKYYSAYLEYDNYFDEIADLQNQGYVYVVLK